MYDNVQSGHTGKTLKTREVALHYSMANTYGVTKMTENFGEKQFENQ